MKLRNETTFNLVGFYQGISRAGMLEEGKMHGVTYVRNPSGAWPNFLFGGDHAEQLDIKGVASSMKNNMLPAFWIRQIDQDNRFDQAALECGIRQVSSWTGMALDMSNLIADATSGKRLEFRRVTGKAELAEWLEIINTEVITGNRIELSLMEKLMEEERYYLFGLWRDKEMVSTALVFNDGVVGGLYFIATRSNERGQGYGTAVVGKVLNYCFSKGIYKFVLHATQGGIQIYSKFGFEENGHYGIYWMLGKR